MPGIFMEIVGVTLINSSSTLTWGMLPGQVIGSIHCCGPPVEVSESLGFPHEDNRWYPIKV